MSNTTENVVAVVADATVAAATVETSAEPVTLVEKIKNFRKKLIEIQGELESGRDFTKAELNALNKIVGTNEYTTFCFALKNRAGIREFGNTLSHEIGYLNKGLMDSLGPYTRYKFSYPDGEIRHYKFYNPGLILYSRETEDIERLLKQKYDSIKA